MSLLYISALIKCLYSPVEIAQKGLNLEKFRIKLKIGGYVRDGPPPYQPKTPIEIHRGTFELQPFTYFMGVYFTYYLIYLYMILR